MLEIGKKVYVHGSPEIKDPIVGYIIGVIKDSNGKTQYLTSYLDAQGYKQTIYFFGFELTELVEL